MLLLRPKKWDSGYLCFCVLWSQNEGAQLRVLPLLTVVGSGAAHAARQGRRRGCLEGGGAVSVKSPRRYMRQGFLRAAVSPKAPEIRVNMVVDSNQSHASRRAAVDGPLYC